MSSFNTPRLMTGAVANADLSAKQFCAIKLTTTGKIDACGANEMGIGFLMNKPLEGEICEVATIGGGALGISAATMDAGLPLKSDASGHLVLADTDKDKVVAISAKPSADNDVFEVIPVIYELSRI